MGFLTPLALAFAGLALPIIIFYMLKLRRRPARVSSLLLWQQVVQDRQANAPWQRLKRNLLLLLQLLILALLVLALARPYLNVPAEVQGNVVILLDASASMQATDVSPSRFAAAQAEALALIERLGANDAVSLLAVESTPRLLASATTDRAALRRALDQAQSSNGPADWPTALTLAAANAATLPDATVVIISDGAFGSASSEPATPHAPRTTPDLTNFPAPLQFIPIGSSAANQGLIALSLRDGPAGPQLFLRVHNAADSPVRRLVEIEVDGQLFDARRLDLPAGDSASLTLSGLPLDTRQVQARLTGSDILAADDLAWASRSAAPANILLVGPGNLFVGRVLALLPGVTVQRADPDQPLPNSPFDLVIFDRSAPPAELPQSSLLFIAPPATTPLFEVSGVFTQTRLTRLERSDPLLSYVELNNVRIGQAQAVSPPPWGRTLIAAEGGPLLIAGEHDKQRLAILTFDLHRSDLPLQIDFPILMVNLARWLLPGDTQSLQPGQTYQAGQRVPLPAAAGSDTLIVRRPDGAEISLPSDQAAFAGTDALGLYQVMAQTADQAEPTRLADFAVNLLDEGETALQPGELTAGPDPAQATAATTGPLTGQREWWSLAALLALAVLLLEWWVYWRGEVR